MDLSALLPVIDRAVDLDRLRRRMSDERQLMLGVSDGAKAAVLAALARDATIPILVIVPRPQHADALADELRAWLGEPAAARVLLFPERDTMPYERLAPDPDDVTSRLQVLDALTEPSPPSALSQVGRGGQAIVVACAAAVGQRTLSPDELARVSIAVRRGERVRQLDVLRALDAGGYRIEPQVTAPGEASRRGGIIDVWPPAEDLPLRIELFGDDVESIRAFDPATQRSFGTRDDVRIGPARELAVEPARLRQLGAAMQLGGRAGHGVTPLRSGG